MYGSALDPVPDMEIFVPAVTMVSVPSAFDNPSNLI